MTLRCEIVIVVPRYRMTLSKFEELSLCQVKHILGNYDIVFISPQSMKQYYERDCKVEFFEDECFRSHSSYSNLLISRDFYERFKNYKYMLIYQLDAYVFRDELIFWCDKGYDFLGAPMPFFSSYELSMINSDKRGYVGNGGLSLRNIESSMRILNYLDEAYSFFDRKYIAEDMIFSFFGLSKKYDFSVPSIDVAEKFSIEFDVDGSYSRISDKCLPFGIHGWSKPAYLGLWEKYLNLENNDCHLECKSYSYYEDYFDKWVKRGFNLYMVKNIIPDQIKLLMDTITLSKKIRVWGAGIRGQECLKLLAKADVKVDIIIDAKVEGEVCGIPVSKYKAYNKSQQTGFIIITPKQSAEEIASILNDTEMEKEKDYIFYDDLLQKVVELNYNMSSWELYKKYFKVIGMTQNDYQK